MNNGSVLSTSSAKCSRGLTPSLHMRTFAHGVNESAEWKGDQCRRMSFLKALVGVIRIRTRTLFAAAVLVKASKTRRVSTTLRQVVIKFGEFFMRWVFHKEISRQDRLGTTIANSVDPQHPDFCFPQAHFAFPKYIAVGNWPAC